MGRVLQRVCIVALAAALPCAVLAQFDPDTGIVSDARWRSGVPLGGIGCGAVELMTDGALGNATINHNWDRPTGVLKGAFAAVHYKAGPSAGARVLRGDSKLEYDGVANIRHTGYLGLYPRAEVEFADTDLPIKVDLHAWSPLIPRNPGDSSLPMAFFDFTLQNAGQVATQAAVLMSWENLLGFGGRRDVAWDSSAGNQQVRMAHAGWRGLRFTTSQTYHNMRQNTVGEYFLGVQDEEGLQVTLCPSWDPGAASPAWWKQFEAEGMLSAVPATGPRARPAGAVAAKVNLQPGQARTVRFTIAWWMPTFRMEHGTRMPAEATPTLQDAGRAAFDGDPATRWGTGRGKAHGDEFILDLKASHSLNRLVLDSAPSPNDYPAGYRIEASPDGESWQEVASATAQQARSRQKTGALTIDFPARRARYLRITNLGHEDHWWWSIHELNVAGPKGDIDLSQATARQRLVQMVTKKVSRDVGHYYQQSFPDMPSMLAYARRSRDRLLGETRQWQDLVWRSSLPHWLRLKLINCAYTMYSATVLTRDGRFAVMESPIDMGGALGTMDQRMAAHGFYTQMFPELDKSELRLFLRCQQADGRITHFNGNFHEIIGNPKVGYGITDWPDLSCSWIMQVLKLYRWTGDRQFLDEMWPGIQAAIAWLEVADEDGDLIPEGGSTYDYETLPRGAFIYSASCYLGALLAAEEAATVQENARLSQRYRERFLAVQKAVLDRLWNGRFFAKWRAAKGDAQNPNSFVAALAGDWLAHLCGLRDTLPSGIIDRQVEQLIARHVNPFFPVPPMEVTPGGRLATSACFVLQHEPYLGCEAIYRGYVDDGLEVLRRVYHCAWEQNHSPWDQSLVYSAPSGRQGGLRAYMTCPTSWHVLNALSGVTLDVPGKTLYISPRHPAEEAELHMPVFMAGFWGWLDYAPDAELRLRIAKVFPGGEHEITHIARDGCARAIALEEPFRVEAGVVLDLSSLAGRLELPGGPKKVEWAVKPGPPRRHGLGSEEWTVTASSTGAEEGQAEPVKQAIDGDTATRWTTGRSQAGGEWLQLDLGRVRPVKAIWADLYGSKQDYPRGCDVLVSDDAEQWRTVATLSRGESRRSVRHQVWRCELEPVQTRYIKIVQTGRDSFYWWSIHELYVLGPGDDLRLPEALRDRGR